MNKLTPFEKFLLRAEDVIMTRLVPINTRVPIQMAVQGAGLLLSYRLALVWKLHPAAHHHRSQERKTPPNAA